MKKTDQPTYRARKGFKLLKRKLGPDWYDFVSTHLLDIGLGKRCILGQLYLDYWDGLDQLRLNKQQGYEYGFTPEPCYQESTPVVIDWEQESDRLTRIWTKLILEARKADEEKEEANV